jgi:hypothetical protein
MVTKHTLLSKTFRIFDEFLQRARADGHVVDAMDTGKLNNWC